MRRKELTKRQRKTNDEIPNEKFHKGRMYFGIIVVAAFRIVSISPLLPARIAMHPNKIAKKKPEDYKIRI